jgi:hypothetical protein
MAKTTMTFKPVPRPGWLADNVLPLMGVLGCTIALSLGWSLFSNRLDSRTSRAAMMSDEVAHKWGGALVQPHPEVRWRREDAATAELTAGEVSQSNIAVTLDAEYRRQGITEYPCYQSVFDATYTFKNPSSAATFVAFTVGMPSRRDALMLSDIKLEIEGKEDPEHTEYTPEHVVWTGRLEGNKPARFHLSYHARGMERFGYSFNVENQQSSSQKDPIKPVTDFQMRMTVNGVHGELDWPTNWMSPTATVPGTNGAGTQLVWSVDRLLTSFDLGVVLPDNRGLANALGRLIDNALAFYLMFAAGLLYALSHVKRRARTLHLLGLSGAYFLYFPLATYLTVYLPWPVACSISLFGITVLGTLHAFRFVDAVSALKVGLCHVFFLAVPAMAYLVPAHTGLTLVVAGFVALGLGLQVVGVLAKRVREDDEVPGPLSIPVPFVEPAAATDSNPTAFPPPSSAIPGGAS